MVIMNEILKKRIEEAADCFIHMYPKVGLDGVATSRKDAFSIGAEYVLSHQWISVEDALPEYNEVVIVAYGDDEYAFCHRSNSKYVHTDNNNFCNYGDKGVLAWMHIPKFEPKK